jgi:hypothetical protein
LRNQGRSPAIKNAQISDASSNIADVKWIFGSTFPAFLEKIIVEPDINPSVA